MYKQMFRNRWFAIGWVVLTLVSVAGFVSEGGGLSQFGKAGDEIRAQQRAMDRLANPEPHMLTIDAETAEGATFEEGTPAAAPSGAKASGHPTVAPEGDEYVVIDDSTPIQEASDEELEAMP